jgi:hypothetical protein
VRSPSIGVVTAAVPPAGPPDLLRIEAELETCLRSWRSIRDFDACDGRRLELLERAVATPVRSQADADCALRIALKAGSDGGLETWDDDTYGMGRIGQPEDLLIANLIRGVQRYPGASLTT